MATAQVIFHRFFFVSSMCSFGIQDVSISALYLSTKLNETPTRLRDLINTYMFLAARIKHLLSFPADQDLPYDSPVSHQFNGSADVGPADTVDEAGKGKGKGKQREKVWESLVWEVPGFHDEVFWDWKDTIVANEMQILKRLGFNMQVDLPYNHAINYLKILDLVFEPDLAQTTWSVLNDLLLTPVYAIHPSNVIACAAILLTARTHQLALPEDWYLLFDADLDDIRGICDWAIDLWRVWGLGPVAPQDKPDVDGGADRKGQDDLWNALRSGRENRWRRAWVLMESKRAVRRWVEDMDKRAAKSG